jgi:CheY-like chemotaxis protein/two-component sensor histidine kinase
LGELAAGVGHEINNPLSISSGFIVLIKKELEKDNYNNEAVYKKIEKVKHGHERIKNIVDGLRTYARSDTDDFKFISMREAIDQTVNLISGIYEKDGVSILKNNKEMALYTMGSIGKLQQIIMNLISNAKDATAGQEKREIKLSLKEGENRTLIFSVEDNGCGISDDIKDKILNPFFTTKEIGTGTGMGLGITGRFVEEMKGELIIDSEVGKGSTFSIVLPSIDGMEFTKEKEKEKEKETLKGVVLVVDDEEAIREILTMYLENLGLEVEEADDGDTALEKVKLKKYDYIFTDMNMKRIGGDEFILKARELPYGDTKYFIVTGGVLRNNVDKIKHIISGYITKPFTEESVYTVLSNNDIS